MWKNVSDDKKLSYSFNDGCSIELSFDKDKSYYEGESVIDGRQYFITRKGFWKTNVTLTKPDGNVVATLLQEVARWHGPDGLQDDISILAAEVSPASGNNR